MDFNAVESNDYREVLCIIVDLNFEWWTNDHNFELQNFVETISYFSRMYINLNPQNDLAIIGICNEKNEYIYTTDLLNNYDYKSSNPNDNYLISDSLNRNNFNLDQQIRNKISELIDVNDEIGSTVNLSGGFLKGLCFYKRKNNEYMEKNKTKEAIEGRFLVIRTSNPESNKTFMSTMNAIFGIQKLNIYIDLILLKSNLDSQPNPSPKPLNPQDSSMSNNVTKSAVDQLDSSFSSANHNCLSLALINQSHSSSKSTMVEVENPYSLLYYMTTLFMTSKKMQKELMLSYINFDLQNRVLQSVDYSASCVCHDKKLHVGFVCSLCLSVYCNYDKECVVCQNQLTFEEKLAKEITKK